MNLVQSLKALSDLASQLGLPEGLEDWELLAQHMQSGAGDGKNEEKGELEQIEHFVVDWVKAVKENSPKAEQYFETVHKRNRLIKNYETCSNII